MKTHGHWSKFSDAQRDLQGYALKVRSEFREVFETASALLTEAQRFYLPDSVNVLLGKPIDEQAQDLMRSPYACVALLSECNWEDGPGSTWKISLAVAPSADEERKKARYLSMLSIVQTAQGWTLSPPIIGAILFGAHGGYGVGLQPPQDKARSLLERGGATETQMTESFLSDAVSLTNLFAILNLDNTKPLNVPVPSALKRARCRDGKRPLYDYHVLEVNGERWDSPLCTITEHGGVRSHLRRGHIRRLPGGRNTWVRAAYVHGSVDGFVDKDYSVRAA